MAKIVARVIGALYVVAGLAGLVVGDDTDRYHNLLHLVTGLIALYVGFVASLSAAKVFCLAFGVAYLAFGILGITIGNPETDRLWDLGLISVSMGDHVHHTVLGAIMLAGGLLTKGGDPQNRTGAIPHAQSAVGSDGKLL
jgi:Domain of unknown function (DUF4383)